MGYDSPSLKSKHYNSVPKIPRMPLIHISDKQNPNFNTNDRI